MRFPLPEADPARLRAALTAPAALRAWWDPDELPAVRDAGDTVVWAIEGLGEARFDLGARAVTLGGLPADLTPAEQDDVALGWELALAALAWWMELPSGGGGRTAPRWERAVVPVALAYSDAWPRFGGLEGLACGSTGERVHVRIAGARLTARVRLHVPPRAVVLALGPDGASGLLRVALGPGASVNAAQVDWIVPADAPEGGLPDGWQAWFARRLGMTWVAQLGEDG